MWSGSDGQDWIWDFWLVVAVSRELFPEKRRFYPCRGNSHITFDAKDETLMPRYTSVHFDAEIRFTVVTGHINGQHLELIKNASNTTLNRHRQLSSEWQSPKI